MCKPHPELQVHSLTRAQDLEQARGGTAREEKGQQARRITLKTAELGVSRERTPGTK